MTPDTGMPAGARDEQGSERDLVSRLRRGDEDAFEHLVREHGGRLLAVARRFLDSRLSTALARKRHTVKP